MAAKLATMIQEKAENLEFNDFFSKENKELVPSRLAVNEDNIEKAKSEINEIHFKKLLDITASVYKQTEKNYVKQFSKKNITYKDVYTFLNKKPGAFKKEIIDEITGTFIRYLDDKNAIFWNGRKLPKSVVIAIQSSFKIVSGHSFTSFLNVMKSKAYDGFGRETLKALNYLKISNVRISEKVNYCKCLEDQEIVNKVMEENPALFYPSFAYIGFKGLNQYQDFKTTLTSLGLTKKGWKFMCSQSRNYNLRAMRKIKVGIFCMNNGLKDAWLRNEFLAAWMTKENLSQEKQDILLKEIQNYNGPVKDFSPFEIRKRKYGLSVSYESAELDQLEDYLRNKKTVFLRDPVNRGKEFKEDSKTLFQLIRRSERWHEEVFNKEKGELKEFLTYPIKEIDIDNFKFKQIENSWDLKKEGDKMHHCVFSYSDRCFKNKYAVYTVDELVLKENSKTLERATLGLSVEEKLVIVKDKETGQEIEKLTTNITFSQMYGHCNSRVSDEMHKAAKKLIKDLNQEINE